MTQKEYIGVGAIEVLESLLLKYSAKKVFLVTGSNSYGISGAQEHLDKLLAGYEVNRYSDFSCNPKIEDVNKEIEAFKRAQCDMVIAVGGGSVIDMAKLINFFAVSDLKPLEYLKASKSKTRKPKPLIAISTTAGSGSEATHFAVLYIGHKKYSVAHKYIIPEVAIVDPQVTMSLPPKITAVTGMDALSQAIESYWAVNSNDLSKKYAGKSIKIIMANLETAVNNPTQSVRTAMTEAAHLAGKAINITKTTAAHAISYPITSYFNVMHGQAVGLMLPSVFEYNTEVCQDNVSDPRGVAYVRKTMRELAVLIGECNTHGAKRKLESLMSKIGLKTRLGKLEIVSQRDIELIIQNGFDPERVRNNPRKVTEEGLRAMLYGIR